MNFADKLLTNVQKTSPISLGIDPNFNLMPDFLKPKTNSETEIKNSLINFSKLTIDATKNLICSIKVQSAYFEQFGTIGLEALAVILDYIKKQNLLSILDVKRGDIGSTSQAYAHAFLGPQTIDSITYQSDLEADCITINPFMGDDSIAPFAETAIKNKKGLFILCKTSNPGSSVIMDKKSDSKLISHHVADLIHNAGLKDIGSHGFSSIGAVIGATCTQDIPSLIERMPNAPILMPGMGTQGGSIETIKQSCHKNGLGAIVPISRSLTYPKGHFTTADQYKNAINEATQSFVELFN